MVIMVGGLLWCNIKTQSKTVFCESKLDSYGYTFCILLLNKDTRMITSNTIIIPKQEMWFVFMLNTLKRILR